MPARGSVHVNRALVDSAVTAVNQDSGDFPRLLRATVVAHVCFKLFYSSDITRVEFAYNEPIYNEYPPIMKSFLGKDTFPEQYFLPSQTT